MLTFAAGTGRALVGRRQVLDLHALAGPLQLLSFSFIPKGEPSIPGFQELKQWAD